MHIPLRPEATRQSYRVGTEVLVGLRIIVAVAVVMQAAFVVVLLPLEAQAEVAGVVVGSGAAAVAALLPASPQGQGLLLDLIAAFGVDRLWGAVGVIH